ncbi:hypothetical protein ACFL6M_06155, partial [Candidatus Eisenbacteria bacterium]
VVSIRKQLVRDMTISFLVRVNSSPCPVRRKTSGIGVTFSRTGDAGSRGKPGVGHPDVVDESGTWV